MTEAMEAWSWPPAYDNSYRPDPAQPYWFPVRETMPPDERDRAVLVRIQAIMRYAWDRALFYRNKWSEAGISPDSVRTLQDFERVPVVTKAELRLAQAESGPFGDYLCIDEADVFHIHGTSGTTGRPTAFGIGRADWNAIANASARVMWGMGIRPSDTVFIGAFFSLYMGSWAVLAGAERLGCRVFPFGAGAVGQTARAVQWLDQMRPTAFYGTPSYARHIAETARSLGVDSRQFGLKRLFFSGEPGASVPTIRSQIEQDFDAEVFDCGSMAEMSPWMNLGETTGRQGMLAWQDIVYTEVVDPTRFSRVPFGREGTPVYTHLERMSQPMIRLLSGDLTRWESGPAVCGRTYPVLPRGIYGRIDDMFTVRGENIYPSAIDDVVMAVDGYGGEHRIIVSRDRTMDELTVEIECSPEVQAQGVTSIEALGRTAADRLRTVLGVGAKVMTVPPGTFDRTDLKAHRVVDRREFIQSRQPTLG
jgi:phenylacetate-CoA ligase